MYKKIIAVAVSVALSLGVSACSKADNNVSTENPKELEEISVVLDWYPNAVHSFMYTAIEKGYYEEEGLKVNIKFPSNPNDAISLPAAGKADIGIYYLQDVIKARVNEGIPVKAVGTVVQAPLSVVISLKEKEIKSPADLVGKKIGYGGTDLSEAIISTMLENEGKSPDAVEAIDVGFDIMSSMTTGNVDATIGGLVNHEVPAMESEGIDVNYFYPTDFGVPDYYELVFVTGDKNLNNNSNKISRFLKASKRGFDDMKANSDESLKILMDNQNADNFPLKEDVEKKSFECILPIMETENTPFLTQDTKVWQDNIDWMFEKGLVNKKIDANEIVVNLQ